MNFEFTGWGVNIQHYMLAYCKCCIYTHSVRDPPGTWPHGNNPPPGTWPHGNNPPGTDHTNLPETDQRGKTSGGWTSWGVRWSAQRDRADTDSPRTETETKAHKKSTARDREQWFVSPFPIFWLRVLCHVPVYCSYATKEYFNQTWHKAAIVGALFLQTCDINFVNRHRC